MKVIALFVFLTAFAQHSVAAVLSLTCDVVACKDIEKPANGSTWCQDKYSILNFSIPLDALKDQKEAIFKSYDGDQVSTLKVDSQDLVDLLSGRGELVKAKYIDGYIWDQEYQRYELSLLCKRY